MELITYTGTKLDFLTFQIRCAMPKGLHLNDGEVTLLAYLFLFKGSGPHQFVEDGHSKSIKSTDNYLSSLRRKGLVVGKTDINPELFLAEDPANYLFAFQIVEP